MAPDRDERGGWLMAARWRVFARDAECKQVNTAILLPYCCNLEGREGDKGNPTPALDLERARVWGELSDGADSRGGGGGGLRW